ncbi:MAG: hypothetical protein JXQ80_00580 [Bacteroidales bacterium]|nr:hypothetical protein [Bacteroidales bacterium]
MELTHLNQINFAELRFEKFDCFIAATGDQARCYHLAGLINVAVPLKYVLSPCEPEQVDTCQYLSQFLDNGFRLYSTAKNNFEVLDKLLHEICNIHTHHLNILIDYSCMPKKWYALLIDSMTRNTFATPNINLYLSYTPKVFNRQEKQASVDYIGPVLYNRDALLDRKPLSMIASLDNSRHPINEAISKVKPQRVLAFIPRCSHDPAYTQLVIDNNKTLLDRLDSNSIITYEVERPEEINSLLTSYCLEERLGSEVMIIPQGPKTFALMSMLLSTRYPDVKVWEIVAKEEKKTKAPHGQPAASPVVVKASFIDDDYDPDE